jgi:hypothetical protein
MNVVKQSAGNVVKQPAAMGLLAFVSKLGLSGRHHT